MMTLIITNKDDYDDDLLIMHDDECVDDKDNWDVYMKMVINHRVNIDDDDYY
jgi:hypothetical protein